MDLLKCIQTERNLLSISGFYPGKNTILQSVHATIHLTISIVQLLSSIAQVLVNFDNFEKILGNSFLPTHMAFVCKLLYFLLHSKRMELIEDILRSKIFKFTTKVEVKIVNEAISYVDKIAKCFRLLCAFTILFYGLAPFINVAFIGGKLELPLPGWIPYNTDNKFLYFITFTFQMASISISAYNNSTIDILNFKLITLATSKLEILVIYLKNIDYEQMGNEATVELKKCVTFYSEILRFGTAIEDMFSNGILVQYLASIIVICLAGFQVDVVSMEFTIFFTYFMAMVMQVALYCWYGHNLMVQSEELTNACYMSSWYVSDLKTRKILFIFMERAKKPIVLTAGKFFNLSLATLIAILRSSYSYFTVLRRLYQDK